MANSSSGRGRRTVAVGLAVAAVVAVLGVAGGAQPAGASGQPPVAVADTATAVSGVERTVAAPGVLANDTDGEGDALTASIVTGASNGTLSLQSNGSFTYTSDAGFTGADTFAYRAFDGTELSETVLVSIRVLSANQAFVTEIYRDFLLREPDPSGLAFWSGRLDRGVESRGYFVHRQSRSHEYAVKVVNRLYADVLGRSVDPSGREFWARRIQKGMSPGRLLYDLMASPEFLRKSGGTNEGFVDKMYEGILDRLPTDSERTAAVAQIAADRGRGITIGRLYSGTESRERRVRVQYQDLLDRLPTDPELAAGVAKLVGAFDDVNFAVWIASGDEYYAEATD